MHDAVIGERVGTPAVAIMTTKFVSAAELMARVLGAHGYAFVIIEHPISSASPGTLAQWASKAAEEGVAILTSPTR